MRIIDKIVSKFGTDKVLHFLGGGWIVSLFSPIGYYGLLIGFILMLVVSIIKEKWLDDFFEWKDILAASIGGCISVLFYVILSQFL